MKRIISFLLIAIVVFACQKNNRIIISGKISNPVDEPIRVRINYFESIDTVTVNADGSFLTEMELDKEHLGELYYQNYVFPIYMEPGAKIHFEFDAIQFKNLTISGEKSKNTEFLYSLVSRWNNLYGQEVLKIPVDSFIQLVITIQNETLKELKDFEKTISPSQKFVEIAKLRSDLTLVFGIDYYKRRTQQDNIKVLADFHKELTDKIPLNDEEKCKEIDEYKYYLTQHHQVKINEKMEAAGLYKETSAYINRLADEIISLDAPQVVKDDIADWMFSVFYKRPDSLRQIYRARYKDVVKNEKYIKAFEKIADARDRLILGNTAPTFNYPDINGKMVSLESLKGKVIYIDVWATWCGPCIAEIPYLKELQNELKNEEIAFVGISLDSEKDKEAWKKMVEGKEIGGYQLYAKGESESKIATDYVIRGIPYFIIIDKDGKLVEVFASRPSDPETKEKLLKLAKS